MTYPIRGYKDEDTGEEISGLTYEQIQEYKTRFLADSIKLYNNFKLFGLPHGKGWLNERGSVLEILMTLESESNLYDSWEAEKASKH